MIRTNSLFCLLLLIFPLVFGGSIYYEDCEESPSRGLIMDVQMDGCDSTGMDDPCHVNHGDVATGFLVFETAVATNRMTCDIYGIIAGTELPFPGGCPHEDACLELDPTAGAICPLQEGDQFTYLISMEILPDYPAVKVIGKWILRDDNDQILVCFKVPIQINAD